MKKRMGLLGLILGIGLLGAGTVWAVPPEGHEPEGTEMGCPGANSPDWEEGGKIHLMQRLELNQEQIKKLKEEKIKNRKEMVKIKAEMENLQIDLWSEATNDKPDDSKLEKLTAQIGGLHGKMLANRVKAIIYLRTLLTPEQKKKLEELDLRFGGQSDKGMHHRGKSK